MLFGVWWPGLERHRVGAAQVREHYIAAESTNWRYRPLSKGQSGSEDSVPVFKKIAYREYEADFQKAKPTDTFSGLLGPTLRAEVGDTLIVHFKNMANKPLSIHPQGIAYSKLSEGYLYADRTSSFEKLDDAVPPGQVYKYTWEITSEIGPKEADPSCLTRVYYSHENMVTDFNSGLIGALLVCKKGSLNEDGTQKLFDREYVLMFAVFDESKSWQKSASLLYTINGYANGTLPDLEACTYDNISWHLIGMSSKPEIFSIHFNGQVLEQNHHKVSTVSIVGGASTTANMTVSQNGRWLISSLVQKHLQAGMHGYLNIEECEEKDVFKKKISFKELRMIKDWEYFIAAEEITWDYAPNVPETIDSLELRMIKDWEYFIAAEEITWDYAPNVPETIDRHYKTQYLDNFSNLIGKKYKKAVFRQYTDANFNKRLENPRPQETGILGPIIRAQVRDRIKIVFKNMASRPYSIYLHGVTLSKAAEGATDPLNSTDNSTQSKAVQPGDTYTYNWSVMETDQPTAQDAQCITRLYHSAVDVTRDIASGLIGPLLICKSEALNKRGVQNKADVEQQAVFAVFDENKSWYLEDNIKQYCSNPSSVKRDDPKFYKSNIMHSEWQTGPSLAKAHEQSVMLHLFALESVDRGRKQWGSHAWLMVPTGLYSIVRNAEPKKFFYCESNIGTEILGFCQDAIVQWHVSSIGSQDEIVSIRLSGHSFLTQGKYEDVLNLFPMSGESVTVEMDNIGHAVKSVEPETVAFQIKILFLYQYSQFHRETAFQTREPSQIIQNLSIVTYLVLKWLKIPVRILFMKPQSRTRVILWDAKCQKDVDDYEDVPDLFLDFSSEKILKSVPETSPQTEEEMEETLDGNQEPSDDSDYQDNLASFLGLRTFRNTSMVQSALPFMENSNTRDTGEFLETQSTLLLPTETESLYTNYTVATRNHDETLMGQLVRAREEAQTKDAADLLSDRGTSITPSFAILSSGELQEEDSSRGEYNVSRKRERRDVFQTKLYAVKKMQALLSHVQQNESLSFFGNTSSEQLPLSAHAENTSSSDMLGTDQLPNKYVEDQDVKEEEWEEETSTEKTEFPKHADNVTFAEGHRAENNELNLFGLSELELPKDKRDRNFTLDNASDILTPGHSSVAAKDKLGKLIPRGVKYPSKIMDEKWNMASVKENSRMETNSGKLNVSHKHPNLKGEERNVNGTLSKSVALIKTRRRKKNDQKYSSLSMTPRGVRLPKVQRELNCTLLSSEANHTLPLCQANNTALSNEANHTVLLSRTNDTLTPRQFKPIVIGLPNGNGDYKDEEIEDNLYEYEYVEFDDLYMKDPRFNINNIRNPDDIAVHYLRSRGHMRRYYIAAEEVIWDYAGLKKRLGKATELVSVCNAEEEVRSSQTFNESLHCFILILETFCGDKGIKDWEALRHYVNEAHLRTSARYLNICGWDVWGSVKRELLVNKGVSTELGALRPHCEFQLYRTPNLKCLHFALILKKWFYFPPMEICNPSFLREIQPLRNLKCCHKKQCSHETMQNDQLLLSKIIAWPKSSLSRRRAETVSLQQTQSLNLSTTRNSRTRRDGGNTIYKKVIFRSYVDSTFTVREAEGEYEEHLGILGPVIRAEVDDVIQVHFKNMASRPYSLHSHGLFYEKSSEGSSYEDESPDWFKKDDAVQPNDTYTYVWFATKRSGPIQPGPACRSWTYYSDVNPEKDIHSGLIGPILICQKGTLSAINRPVDTREFVLLFMVFDEEKSWYFDKSSKRTGTEKTSEQKWKPGFKIGYCFSAINGIIYHLQGLRMYKDEFVRWYLLNMGGSKDIHVVHFHGQTFTELGVPGHRLSVYPLLPGSFRTIEMIPSRAGVWFLDTEVGEYQQAGMQAFFIVVEKECKLPMGLMNGLILDSQINASHHVGYWEPKLARLNNAGTYNAWSTDLEPSEFPWIQVDLQRQVLITGIKTQGAKQFPKSLYVKEFFLTYSKDKRKWITFKGNSTREQKLFEGNSDASGIKDNHIDPPIIARYIRVYPTVSYNRPTLRMELLGCEIEGCSMPLGMENGEIKNTQITASSYKQSWYNSWVPSLARLNQQGRVNAWQAKSNNNQQWLQIDLLKAKKITAVATQGCKSMTTEQFVKTYAILYSDEGTEWGTYMDDSTCVGKVFVGNENSSGQVKHFLNPPIFSRFIRIIPKTWNQNIALRVELFGCDPS
uniref:Coagulation factor V n=1 Tax=Pelodiscus sinensis TaxID=13735 RepID=K7F2H6_PELSI